MVDKFIEDEDNKVSVDSFRILPITAAKGFRVPKSGLSPEHLYLIWGTIYSISISTPLLSLSSLIARATLRTGVITFEAGEVRFCRQTAT